MSKKSGKILGLPTPLVILAGIVVFSIYSLNRMLDQVASAVPTLVSKATEVIAETSTPSPTLAPSATFTPKATSTPVPELPTATDTLTPEPGPTGQITSTLTITPTQAITPEPSPTTRSTGTPTQTGTPTATSRPTATPTNTPTSSPTVPPTSTSTPSPTVTSTSTSTPRPTATWTPVPTFTSVPVAPTATASPDFEIVSLLYDDEDEFVIIKKNTLGEQSMSGWKLVSAIGPQTFEFPSDAFLALDHGLIIHSGPGAFAEPPVDLLWSKAYVWNNDGDRAELYDDQGILRAASCYEDGCN